MKQQASATSGDARANSWEGDEGKRVGHALMMPARSAETRNLESGSKCRPTMHAAWPAHAKPPSHHHHHHPVRYPRTRSPLSTRAH